jgi:serine/threonine protein phosphatase PrpC
MSPALPRFLSAASTDPGFVRENNEDRVHADDVRGFYLVVDGMGGHNAGERAADIAVERIRGRLERQTDSVAQRIREAITLANNAIYEAAQSKPEWNGMACVLTVAVVENGLAVVGHVGDSRLYKIRAGAIRKITHDHSPVGEREDRGELTEVEAMRHPRRNEVYRDVGSAEHAPDDEDFIEIVEAPFEPDAALLLCSDGISDVLSSDEILKIVEENAGDRWTTVRRLIVAANEEGKDNVSAVLVEGENFSAGYAKPSAKKRRNPVATDAPPAESTGRLSARPAPAPRAPWYFGRMMSLGLGVAAGVLLALAAQRFLPVIPGPHVAQTIVVAPQSTIGSALDAAQAGDTVEVPPGNYAENIALKDGVNLIAQTPREAVLQGSIAAGGAGRARISGLRVTAANVGIDIADGDIEIERCEVSGAAVAGIRFNGNARGSVIASFIHDNRGSGIVVDGASAPAIENNVVVSNGVDAAAPRPGLLVRAGAHPFIAGNVFLGNGAEAVWLPAADDRLVQRNYFNLSPPKPDRKARKPVRILGAAEGRP